MSTIVCPQCNKDDTIQKISAILDSGKSSGSFSGYSGGVVNFEGKSGSVSGFTNLSGRTISDLATALAPPLSPKISGGFGFLWILVIFIVFGMLAPVGFAITVFLSMVINALPSTQKGLFFIGFFILIILGLIILVSGFAFLRRLENINIKEGEKKYQVEKIKWDRAMFRWNRLYYCHRSGIVFDPESGETCEPANIKDFVYQQSKIQNLKS